MGDETINEIILERQFNILKYFVEHESFFKHGSPEIFAMNPTIEEDYNDLRDMGYLSSRKAVGRSLYKITESGNSRYKVILEILEKKEEEKEKKEMEEAEKKLRRRRELPWLY